MFASKETSSNGRNLTSWHPIQTAKSEDMWELPHPSRPFEEDDGDDNMTLDTSPCISYSWSFKPTMENNNNLHHNEDSDDDSSNTISTRISRTMQKPTAVFGDATNTAPVLNVRRGRYPWDDIILGSCYSILFIILASYAACSKLVFISCAASFHHSLDRSDLVLHQTSTCTVVAVPLLDISFWSQHCYSMQDASWFHPHFSFRAC